MTALLATPFHIADCGDAAVRVTHTAADRDVAWAAVHGLAERLASRPSDSGITSTIATYDAVLVEFDPLRTDHYEVRALIDAVSTDLSPALAAHGNDRSRRLFRVPVVYGDEYGPDLERVAEQQDSTPADVIAQHTAGPLVMRCYGSPGGAPMLDGPTFPRPVPRLASPRAHVPAGAVAVAGRQAVVSARPAPGGWCVLGRTPRTLVDLEHDPLSAFRPGDAFQFFAIAAADWAAYEGRLEPVTS